jgi:outer membrane cobalamin receptor
VRLSATVPGCIVFYLSSAFGSASVDSLARADSAAGVDRMVIFGQRPDHARPSVRIIKADEFKGRYQDLPSVLEQESGVTTRRTGAFGEYSVASIRGGSANHLQVYLNGMPVNSAGSGIVDFSKIPLGVVQQIDIYKEQIPLELMEDGLGGIVSLSTNTKKDIVSANAEAGSFGYQKGSALVSVCRKKMDQQLSLDYGYARNNYPFMYDNGTQYNLKDDYIREKTNNDYTSVYAGYSNLVRFDSTNRLFSNLSYSRGDKGEFLLYSDDTAQGIRNAGSTAILSERFERDFNRSLRLSVLAQGKYRQDSLADPRGQLASGKAQALSQKLPFGEVRLGLRYIYNQFISFNALLFTSVERYQSFESAVRLPFEARRNKIAGGIQCDFAPVSSLRLKVLYMHRYEIDTTTGTYQRQVFVSQPVKVKEHLPNVQAGIEWQPFGNFMAYAGGYYQSRNPGFDEKFATTGYSSGNPGLTPEHKLEASIGIAAGNSYFNSSLALYGGTTRDKIIAEAQSLGVLVPMNYSNVRHWGAEWDVRIEPQKWISFVNAMTYMENTFYNMARTSLNGREEPLMPRFKESLHLTLSWHGVQIGHGLLYSSPYYLSSQNIAADRRSSRPILDAFISYSGIPFITLTYRIENYLDYQNEDYRDCPRPGRMHFVILNFNLFK